MFKRFWNWLVDIPTTDLVERDTNASLQIVSLAFCLITILSFVLNSFVPGRWNNPTWPLVFLFNLAAGILVLVWLRRNRLRPAMLLFATSLALALGLIGAFNGINNSQIILILLAVVLLLAVGLLMSWRSLGITFGVLAVLFIGGSFLEVQGWLPLAAHTMEWRIVDGRGVQTVLVLIAIGLFARFFSWRFNAAVHREQQRAKELHAEIAERELAQQTLRASENDWQLLFEQAPIPMALSDLHGNFLRVNQALCTMLGFSAQELREHSLASITHPDDWPENQALIQQALAGEIKAYQIEKRYLCRDGKLVIGVLHGMILRDAHGQPRQILGQILDVTESRKTETALRVSEERFRVLAENIPGVIYVCRNDFRFTMLYLNDTVETLTGYPKELFLSEQLSFRDLYHPEDASSVTPVRLLEKAQPGWQTFSIEYRVRHKSGEWRWVEDRGVIVIGPGGEPMLEGFLNDITARKQAELALRTSEERFRLLAETVPSVVFLCRDDERFTMLYMNDAVADLTGYDKNVFLSNEHSIVELYHPADRALAFDAPPTLTLASGQLAYQLEYRLKHISGEWRWVEERSLLVISPFGERLFHGVLTDITARKASEAELSLRLTEQTLLYEVGQALAGQTTSQAIFKIVCERMTQYLNGSSAFYEAYLPKQEMVRTDYEFWTERATVNERYSVLGQTWPINDYPIFERSRTERVPTVIHWDDGRLNETERKLFAASDGKTIVVVPAVARDKFLGFFEIWNSAEKQTHPDRTLQLLLAIGAQAASALENLTLLMQRQQAEAELNARLAEQTFLYEMGRALEQSQEILALSEIASRYFADYLQATSVYYFKHLAELERFELEFEFFTERANPQERQTAVGQSWPLGDFQRYYRAVESKWPQVQTRADTDLTPRERYVFEHWNGQTIVLVPVTVKDHYFGYFEIWDSTAVKGYDEHTLQILLTIATQVAFQFENVRLVNELKQAAERARELATAADSANRLKTEIIANISHELRTPLTAIQGSLSLIIQDTASPRADASYWLNVAYEGSEKLLKLINALLSVAKIEARQIQLVHTAVDVPLLMREVEGHVRPLAEEKGLSVQLNIAEVTDWLWLDYEHVRQILLSLLQNAVKFTEDGQIEFAARREGEEVVFIVSDTGIGLAPEIQQQLFRPFGQADGSSTRRYGGFGMGLYTSQRLAELMEGRLQVYSAGQGLGTTVMLRLPWRLAEAELSLAISH